MRRLETRIRGPLVFEPHVFGDQRGFFVETYRASTLAECGVTDTFVQDNHSRSTRGVLRGLHYAVDPGQAKLVRCARGAILDVVVDLRNDSPTFGEWEAFTLDDVTCRVVYIPIGFAHGFVVASAVADVTYKCSSYYDAASERSLAHDDPTIGVAWGDGPHIVSDRDRTAPRLADIADSLAFRVDQG
jgi:dTDP-4-dehydrorhamnose 3,5-epimerase